MAFLGAIKVKERGAAPRGMRKLFNEAGKQTWLEVGGEFNTNYRDKRFTPEHAREAGYAFRKGELLPRGTKAFRRSYTGRKLRMFKHTNPLERTGDTKRALRGNIRSTSKGARVTYPAARVFNFRHPKSKIRMNEEFTRITRPESRELAEFYDRRLNVNLYRFDK